MGNGGSKRLLEFAARIGESLQSITIELVPTDPNGEEFWSALPTLTAVCPDIEHLTMFGGPRVFRSVIPPDLSFECLPKLKSFCASCGPDLMRPFRITMRTLLSLPASIEVLKGVQLMGQVRKSEVLSDFFRAHTNLRKLRLWCTMSHPNTKLDFAVIADCCPALEDIELDERHIVSTAGIERLQSLRRLRMPVWDSLTNAQLRAIFERNANLRHLSLSVFMNPDIDFDAFRSIAGLTKLRSLELVTSTGSEWLTEAQIESFLLELIDNSGASLKRIDFPGYFAWPFSEAVIDAIAEKCPRLRHLECRLLAQGRAVEMGGRLRNLIDSVVRSPNWNLRGRSGHLKMAVGCRLLRRELRRLKAAVRRGGLPAGVSTRIV